MKKNDSVNRHISARAQNICASPTLEISALVKSLRAQGEYIYDLSIGEPSLPTPDSIIKSAKSALDCGHTKYTETAGILPLREEIAKKLARENNLTYDPSQIVVSTGAKQSIANALMSIISEGDEVIIPAPYWVSYPEMVKMFGGTPVIVPTCEDSAYKLTPPLLTSAISTRTKALILNSPCNPTGAIYTERELRVLANIIKEHDLLVISDEIYEKLNYTSAPHFSIAQIDKDMQDRTILINGFSKSFSMTGWRVGYLACAPHIAKAVTKIQGQLTGNTNSIAQHACVTALADKYDDTIVKTLAKNRDIAIEILTKGGVPFIPPSGAFYIMIKLPEKVRSPLEFSRKLLTDAHVAVVPGSAFGAENFIRISFACSENELREGLAQILKFY